MIWQAVLELGKKYSFKNDAILSTGLVFTLTFSCVPSSLERERQLLKSGSAAENEL